MTSSASVPLSYRELRRKLGRFRATSYEISDRCNLWCEGCLYYEGDQREAHKDNPDLQAWDRFFAAEAERGVNYAYLAGAEPSLELARVRIAHKHIPRGLIFTNGIQRIPAEIGYRLHVSIWGDHEHSVRYRGADTIDKAFANYRGDPRTVFVLTVNGDNVGQIDGIARACAAEGQPLTFNFFSNTESYRDKLASHAPNDRQFFRSSTADDNLSLDMTQMARAQAAIAEAQARYPDTVVFSSIFGEWLLRGPERNYQIDAETGVAMDCGHRLTQQMRHYAVDMAPHSGKCCVSNIDCRSCHNYASSYATYLQRHERHLDDDQRMQDWLDVWATWIRIWLHEPTA